MAGIKNEIVFPEPVLAAPIISLPFKAWGIAFAYILVCFIYPPFLNASLVFSEMFKSSNVLSVKNPLNISIQFLLIIIPSFLNSFYCFSSSSFYSSFYSIFLVIYWSLYLLFLGESESESEFSESESSELESFYLSFSFLFSFSKLYYSFSICFLWLFWFSLHVNSLLVSELMFWCCNFCYNYFLSLFSLLD